MELAIIPLGIAVLLGGLALAAAIAMKRRRAKERTAENATDGTSSATKEVPSEEDEEYTTWVTDLRGHPAAQATLITRAPEEPRRTLAVVNSGSALVATETPSNQPVQSPTAGSEPMTGEIVDRAPSNESQGAEPGNTPPLTGNTPDYPVPIGPGVNAIGVADTSPTGDQPDPETLASTSPPKTALVLRPNPWEIWTKARKDGLVPADKSLRDGCGFGNYTYLELVVASALYRGDTLPKETVDQILGIDDRWHQQQQAA